MSILQALNGRLTSWLRRSERVHVRVRGVNDLSDLVGLIDRFLDDRVQYPLEWDDFVSWKHESVHIEKVRQLIEQHEPLLFSKTSSDREKYAAMLIEERNRVAKMIGSPLR
jgi:acyl-CoA hydrolase